MTLKEARQLLKVPVFASDLHIKAKKIVEEDAEANQWKLRLLKKKIECWCCEGRGTLSCRAMCEHECPTCEGEDMLTLTADILADMTIDQLRDIGKDLGVSLGTANEQPPEATQHAGGE